MESEGVNSESDESGGESLLGLHFQSSDSDLPKNDSSSLSSKFLNLLDGIKYGSIDDNHNWITKL